jgi:hypothetical protein
VSSPRFPAAASGWLAPSGSSGREGTKASEDSGIRDLKEEEGFRVLLLLWLTTALLLAGVALVAAIVLKTARIPVHDDAFFAQFCLLNAGFFAPQSAKNCAYLAACLAAPVLLGCSFFSAHFLLRKIPRSRLRLFFRCANIASGIFFAWSVSPVVYCTRPAMMAQWPNWLDYKWFFEDEPFFTFPRVVVLVMAAGICGFFYGRPTSYKNRNLAFAVATGTWLLVVATRFYVPVEINDDWRIAHHFNPIVFGLSQVMSGRHYLVQFPHRYGGYIEFLGPILTWLPRRVETILILFGMLNAISMACLLGIIRLLVRSPLQLLLAAWGLLGILAVDNGDLYYQNAVVRGFFPALGLLLAIVYLRRPGLLLYGIVSVVAAVAPLWNQDTGIVLWCSWAATLIVRDMSENSFRRISRHLALQVFLLLAAVASFLFYLRMISGAWPDPGLFFTFQEVYAGLGYYCLPMLVPDVWMVVVAIYALGLSAAAIFYLRKTFSWRTHALLMISLTGIGSFSYFMGRSAESNLVNTSFLVPVLLGFFLSEARGQIALKRLHRLGWVLLVPLTSIQVWWALIFVLALPTLVERSGEKLANSRLELSSTPFGKNVAFLQTHVQARERLYLLSNQAGFYHYLSNTSSSLNLSSTDEFIWTKDIDRLVAEIDSRRIPKLIVDRNFFDPKNYKDEVYDRLEQAIAQYYRVEATGPDGGITLYVPR